MSSVVKDVTCTLFHVQPTISQFLLDEAKTDFKAKAELQRVIRKNADHARSILEKYKARMVGMGIAEERIDVETQPRLTGLVKDILERGQKGLYKVCPRQDPEPSLVARFLNKSQVLQTADSSF